VATYFHVRRIGELNASVYSKPGDVLQFDGLNNYSRYLWEESLATTVGPVCFPLAVIAKLPEEGQMQLRTAMNSRLCKQVVEYVFEAVRLRQYPDRPSRKTCIFAGKTPETVVEWMRNFGACQRYQVLEIEPETTALIFDGDANLVCYDTPPLSFIETCAEHYWKGARTQQLLEEVLIQGSARIVRVIESVEE
jgi:hypothetical protein